MSKYNGYTEIDNMRRKSNNLSVDTGSSVNRRTKRYTTSGMQARDAGVEALIKKYKKEAIVKEYSQEEIEAYMANKSA